MSRKYWFCMFILLVASIMLVQPVLAEVTFKWGPYLRIRHEFWGNWADFRSGGNETTGQKDNRNFFRIKESLWGQVDLNKNTTLYAKLTNESRAHTYYAPSAAKPSGVSDKSLNYDINEVVFDNFYVDLKNFGDLPVDFRIGRQDLMGQYGENFLISDGTPQDGSRTIHFDAVKGTWRINKTNSLDVIGLKDDRTEEKLPVINRLDGKAKDAPTEQNNNLSDEKGVIVYLKSDPNKALHLENYYIYKQEEGVPGKQFSEHENQLRTVGSFAKYTFGPYTAKGQIASQFGEYGPHDRKGIGGYTFLTRNCKEVKFNPVANVGYMYLSGDDQGDDVMTAWDPLFSRWPVVSDLYSELYYLNYNTEGGALGYWTNLKMYKVGVTVSPTKKTKFGLAYYIMQACESRAGSIFGGVSNEKDRGKLVTGKFDYAFNKRLSAYVMGEYFIPGDFYSVNNRHKGVFVRTQIEYKY